MLRSFIYFFLAYSKTQCTLWFGRMPSSCTNRAQSLMFESVRNVCFLQPMNVNFPQPCKPRGNSCSPRIKRKSPIQTPTPTVVRIHTDVYMSYLKPILFGINRLAYWATWYMYREYYSTCWSVYWILKVVVFGEISVNSHIKNFMIIIMTIYFTLNFDIYIILQMNVNHVDFKIPFFRKSPCSKEKILDQGRNKKAYRKVSQINLCFIEGQIFVQ